MKRKRIVVGCLGRAGAGKSTAAKYIAEKYSGERFAFGNYVKEMARRVYGFSDTQLFGSQAEKEEVDPRVGISGREGCVRIGEAARAVFGEHVWVDACFRDVNLSSADVVVIEDVRRINEAKHIATSSEFYGFVIKLDYAQRKSDADPYAPTEICVDEVDQAHIFEIVHHWNDDRASLYEGLDRVMLKIQEATQ